MENLVKTQSRDAREWAREFCAMTQFADVDLAHTWFANAMMAMHDSIFNNELKEAQEKIDKMKNYMNCNSCKCRSLVRSLVDPASACPCKNWELMA